MKKLKLKMKDLTNPSILSSKEISNITGGSHMQGSSIIYDCVIMYNDGRYNYNYSCMHPDDLGYCIDEVNQMCYYDSGCIQGFCM